MFDDYGDYRRGRSGVPKLHFVISMLVVRAARTLEAV